jgi:hypothetical protein
LSWLERAPADNGQALDIASILPQFVVGKSAKDVAARVQLNDTNPLRIFRATTTCVPGNIPGMPDRECRK